MEKLEFPCICVHASRLKWPKIISACRKHIVDIGPCIQANSCYWPPTIHSKPGNFQRTHVQIVRIMDVGLPKIRIRLLLYLNFSIENVKIHSTQRHKQPGRNWSKAHGREWATCLRFKLNTICVAAVFNTSHVHHTCVLFICEMVRGCGRINAPLNGMLRNCIGFYVLSRVQMESEQKISIFTSQINSLGVDEPIVRMCMCRHSK